MSGQETLLLQLVYGLVALYLCDSNNDLPSVAAGKHVEIYFNLEFVRSRSPSDVSDNLFPVEVAAMRRSVIIGEQDMRPETLLAPQPRHLRPIPVSKLGVLVGFETIRSSLKGRSNEQVLSCNQILRMDFLDQDFGWDQGKPNFLQYFFEFVNLLLSQFSSLEFELLFVSKIKITISSCPSETC